MESKTLQDRLKDYYRGERVSNAILIVIGATGIVWTLLIFLWRQGNLSSAMFFSAFPLGVFYVITGGYRFVRSLKRYKLGADIISGLDFLINSEKDHLEGRAERFRRKRKIDLFGVLFGFFVVTSAMIMGWNHLILGTAISICIFSAILLAFDLFGQFRTEEFLHHINKEAEINRAGKST